MAKGFELVAATIAAQGRAIAFLVEEFSQSNPDLKARLIEHLNEWGDADNPNSAGRREGADNMLKLLNRAERP